MSDTVLSVPGNQSVYPTTATGDSRLAAITVCAPKPITIDASLANNWFWKLVPVDPLIFALPNHDGSTIQVARQVYHRMLGRIVAENAYVMQLGIVFLAWLATIILGKSISFRGAGNFGLIMGLGAFGAFLFFAVPILMRIASPRSAGDEVRAIVRRTFFSDLPANTPPDLRDEQRQSWLTADGRPLSSEISADDGRTTEANRRTIWWIVTAVAVGWAVDYLFVSAAGRSASPEASGDLPPGFGGGFGGGAAAGGGFGIPGLPDLSAPSFLGSWMVLLILIIKFWRDKRPLAMRAAELAAAEAVEGTAYISAGGRPWAAVPQAARDRQIAEATRDSSPTVELGETTGIFASRGDFFGANAGLPFRLSLRDLQMHMLVLGGTGSGKTSGILRPLARQISEQSGVGLVIMDGKGSLPAELASLAGMKVVDPANQSTEVSLVSGVEPSVIVDTIREILSPSQGGDQFWINSAAGALRRGALIAEAAGGAKWSLFSAAQIVSNKAERDQLIPAVLPKAADDPLLREAIGYFIDEWDTMDAKTQSNILAEIRSWMSTITATADLLRWAKTPAGGDTVDILSPLTGGRLGFMMPEHRYGVAGAVVTGLIKARLYNALKKRADRNWTGGSETPLVFIIDEAQEVATSQDAQMLAIGRSLGLAMVGATQGLEGIKVRLGEGTADKWLSIYGSVVALAGRSAVTDAFVATRAGQSWQLTATQVTGSTVRASLAMEAISGPIAAARNQPHMSQTQMGPAAVAMRGSLYAGPKQIPPPQLMLGPQPVVMPGEISSLTAVPDTAIVLATRGRVPRRDVIRLKPEYPH